MSPEEEKTARQASLKAMDDLAQKSDFYIQGVLREKGLPRAPRDPDLEADKARDILAKLAGTGAERPRLYGLLKNRGFDT